MQVVECVSVLKSMSLQMLFCAKLYMVARSTNQVGKYIYYTFAWHYDNILTYGYNIQPAFLYSFDSHSKVAIDNKYQLKRYIAKML